MTIAGESRGPLPVRECRHDGCTQRAHLNGRCRDHQPVGQSGATTVPVDVDTLDAMMPAEILGVLPGTNHRSLRFVLSDGNVIEVTRPVMLLSTDESNRAVDAVRARLSRETAALRTLARLDGEKPTEPTWGLQADIADEARKREDVANLGGRGDGGDRRPKHPKTFGGDDIPDAPTFGDGMDIIGDASASTVDKRLARHAKIERATPDA